MIQVWNLFPPLLSDCRICTTSTICLRTLGNIVLDPYQQDSDHDNLADGLELEFSSDPLVASTVLRVPPANDANDRILSFPNAVPDNPAFIIFEPGVHSGRIRLVEPCDNVVLIANTGSSGESDVQATISSVTGRALTLVGCNGVRIHNLNFMGNTLGALELRDSAAQIFQSGFFWNSASQGAAIRLVRSHLTVDGTTLQGNSAVTDGGAIWFDRYSTVHLFNSVLSENYSLSNKAELDPRLYLLSVSYGSMAIAGQSVQP